MRRACFFALLFACASLQAQEYPTRPVRLVVPYAPGGQSDTIGRAVVQKLAERWGQPVVVENRAGANTIIGAENVARSPADGYSLLIVEGSALTVNPSLYQKLPYDVIKDFAPITRLTSYGTLLIVHPSVPVKDLKEFVALAKAKPGEITYASFGVGSGGHLNMEALKIQLGVDLTHVPYKGSAPALLDVVAGRVQSVLNSVSSSGPHVKAGRTRALAYANPTRSPILPDVPTFRELGVPFDALSWFCLVTTGGTPRAITGKIQQDVAKIIHEPAFNAQWFASRGLDAVGDAPEQLAEIIRNEIPFWARIIKVAGIKPE